MPERMTLCRQIGLELGAECSSLDRRGPGFQDDRNQTVHVAQTKRHHRARLVGFGIDSAHNVRAAAKRDQTEVTLVRELDESLYLVVRIRKENGVGRSSHHSVSNAEEIRETLAITVQKPLKRVERNLFG